MAYKKVMLIVNPVSRPSLVKRRLPQVQNLLREGGLDLQTCITRAAGDPAHLAREAREKSDAVIVAGGDGSINEALGSLAGSSIPLGIIPFGTVNVFAREIGLPLDPIQAAGAFFKSSVQLFDLGRLGTRPFILMVGYGFDGWALRRNPRFLKRIFGRYSYVLSSLFLLPFYRDEPIRIELEENTRPLKAHFALFCNSSRYAGDYRVAKEADMQDGLLDLVLFNCPGRLGVLKTFISIFSGSHRNKTWIQTVRAKRLCFSTRGVDRFQIDGDPVRTDARELYVEPAAVRVIAPS